MEFILISGPPASGKTTIGAEISKELEIPFFSKDSFKEVLFETIGTKDPESAPLLGRASFALLYAVLEEQLRSKARCIIEANFRRSHDEQRILRLQEAYGAECLQIYCTGSHDVLLQRFEARAQGEERHPGHADGFYISTLAADLKADAYQPLQLKGETLTVDTTKIQEVSLEAVLSTARNFLR